MDKTSILFHLPDIQYDAFEGVVPFWLANEEGIVQPRILAVGRSFKLGSSLEIEGLSCADKSTVAHVDVDTIVRPDGIDGFQFRARTVGTAQLVVGSATENGALQQRPFEGASRDGNHLTASVGRLAHYVGIVESHPQLHGELQLWRVLGLITLSPYRERGHREGYQEKNLFHSKTLFALTIAIDVAEGTALIVEDLFRTEETVQFDGSVLYRVRGMHDVLLVAHR